jgi:hypothetical protein
MPRLRLLTATLALLAATVPAAAATAPPATPTGLVAHVNRNAARVVWNQVRDAMDVVLYRDGAKLVTLPAAQWVYDDPTVAPGGTYTYTVVAVDYAGAADNPVPSAPSAPATITMPSYKVGAAALDISPDLVGLGTVNQGGNGLGDGTGLSALVGRGSQNSAKGDRIKSRAVVFDDGREAVALVTVETQGYFAAYRDGIKGLADMAAAAAAPGLPAENILIAADHTHSGPDTIGAWGGMPKAYFDFVYERTVAAIRQAYAQRRFAHVYAGHSSAYDLIYNQSCPEALYQGDEGVPHDGQHLPCPTGSSQGVNGTDGKDGLLRVIQARPPGERAIVTFAAYAAHATAGGGEGVHGDWPQYLGDAMAARYGGVGMAMQGAVGKTQPCRPHCAFTKKTNPSFKLSGRKAQITANYLNHVVAAVNSATRVSGPVDAAKGYIREAVTSPAIVGLFAAGGKAFGARLLRSTEPPWMNGTTVRTVVSALRVGDVLIAGAPGEAYPEIAFGVRDGTSGAREVITLSLANDQLGYLIAPAAAYPVITAQVAVNDNTIFNVSPTIGDHVMCADIRLARSIGFGAGDPALAAYCAPYDGADLAGDPVSAVPVGGVTLD